MDKRFEKVEFVNSRKFSKIRQKQKKQTDMEDLVKGDLSGLNISFAAGGNN